MYIYIYIYYVLCTSICVYSYFRPFNYGNYGPNAQKEAPPTRDRQVSCVRASNRAPAHWTTTSKPLPPCEVVSHSVVQEKVARVPNHV